MASEAPIPYETRSRVSKMSWSMVSKAADRSSRASTDRSPLSAANRMSVRTLRTAVSVEWWVRYADCRRPGKVRRTAAGRRCVRVVSTPQLSLRSVVWPWVVTIQVWLLEQWRDERWLEHIWHGRWRHRVVEKLRKKWSARVDNEFQLTGWKCVIGAALVRQTMDSGTTSTVTWVKSVSDDDPRAAANVGGRPLSRSSRVTFTSAGLSCFTPESRYKLSSMPCLKLFITVV